MKQELVFTEHLMGSLGKLVDMHQRMLSLVWWHQSVYRFYFMLLKYVRCCHVTYRQFRLLWHVIEASAIKIFKNSATVRYEYWHTFREYWQYRADTCGIKVILSDQR